MKTLTRILLLVVIACAIYFATIGNKQFYRLVYTISDFFEAIASNYFRK